MQTTVIICNLCLQKLSILYNFAIFQILFVLVADILSSQFCTPRNEGFASLRNIFCATFLASEECERTSALTDFICWIRFPYSLIHSNQFVYNQNVKFIRLNYHYLGNYQNGQRMPYPEKQSCSKLLKDLISVSDECENFSSWLNISIIVVSFHLVV